MRVLIIEDDKELCDNISLTLKASGYETDVCHTGRDGLFLAERTPYDAIVLDRMLPEMDGIRVLEHLRRQNIQTPVILATALDGLTNRIDGLDAGADDYLGKPFAVEELMARLRIILRPRTEAFVLRLCFSDPVQAGIFPVGILYAQSLPDSAPQPDSFLCMGSLL